MLQAEKAALETDLAQKAYSGGLNVKVREDGVFSGTGDATESGGGTATLSVKGDVNLLTGAVTAALTWSGESDGGEVVLNASGTLTETPYRMLLSWKGGDQALNFDGTVLLDRSSE